MSSNRETSNNYQKLSEFINNHWKANHILSKNKNLFDSIYLNKNDSFNILTQYEKENIISFLGYIPHSFYDKSLVSNDICYIALWFKHKKINGSFAIKSLIELMQENWSMIASVGINENVKKIYQKLNFQIISMEHYFEKVNISFSLKNKFFLEIRKSDFDIPSDNINNKSNKFIYNKYIVNKFYNYHVIKFDEDLNNSIFVLRKISTPGKSIMRMIDFIGDIESINIQKNNLLKFSKLHNCDHFDFFIAGENELKMNYFKTNERNFLPIYTEPVINKYSKINVAFKKFKDNKNIYFFKGDGDQDRPNKI
tara:strand:+ start:542 stop:1471 length:930 start_codon:yes stop_codon:yes gene_type:complete